MVGAYNLSGGWGAATIIQNGDELTITMPNRGPFLGRYVGPHDIAVAFHDDPGCCTGVVTNQGQVIRWSNRTVWVKNT